jgi:hypothetical protein
MSFAIWEDIASTTDKPLWGFQNFLQNGKKKVFVGFSNCQDLN